MFEAFVRADHQHWDEGIRVEVTVEDCYRISTRDFAPDDIVLDVGANIGYFSALALERGAGLVIAAEASPMNAQALRHNLAVYGHRARVVDKAVWRSDMADTVLHLNEQTADNNPGGITVIGNCGPVEVPTASLDSIIGNQWITLMKMDCEGSEYPILYTAKKLRQVQELVIETHPIDHLITPDANVHPGQNTPEALAAWLAACGFKVTVTPREGLPSGWAYVSGVR